MKNRISPHILGIVIGIGTCYGSAPVEGMDLTTGEIATTKEVSKEAVGKITKKVISGTKKVDEATARGTYKAALSTIKELKGDFDKKLFNEMTRYTFENFKIIKNIEEFQKIFSIEKLKNIHLKTWKIYNEAFYHASYLLPLMTSFKEKLEKDHPETENDKKIWVMVIAQLDLDAMQAEELNNYYWKHYNFKEKNIQQPGPFPRSLNSALYNYSRSKGWASEPLIKRKKGFYPSYQD